MQLNRREMFGCCKKVPIFLGETPQDYEIINWEMALEQCDGDEDFLNELLLEMQEDVCDMKTVFEVSTDTEIMDIAHKIKGIACNLMCDDLANTCSDLESKIREGNKNENYSVELENVIKSIERFDDFMKIKIE